MVNSDIPDIITTPVVPASQDVFWDHIHPVLENIEAKKVLILVQNWVKETEERPLLMKILEACKLQPANYTLLELAADEQIAWHLLREKTQAATVILFGIELQQLGVNAQLMPHQTNRFNNCNWIPTVSLAQIIQYPEIKTHLWNYGLKPVFVDKIYG